MPKTHVRELVHSLIADPQLRREFDADPLAAAARTGLTLDGCDLTVVVQALNRNIGINAESAWHGVCCCVTREPPRYLNASVVQRIANDEGIPEQEAKRWLDELMKFLVVATELRHNTSQDRMPPPHAIDAAWHAFILHTEDYATFCDEEFGAFVHHRPGAPPDAASALDSMLDYLTVRTHVERSFGPLDAELWPL